MALKDDWKDLKDAIEGVAGSGDDISVKPINKIAHAVIDLEKNGIPGGGGGGTGADGFSPDVEVTEIDGGHRVTITDKDGTKSFDVMDGKDGEPIEVEVVRQGIPYRDQTIGYLVDMMLRDELVGSYYVWLPYIGENGNWWIGDCNNPSSDTGVKARGENGLTPHIGENGNWFIGDIDTGVKAEGKDSAGAGIDITGAKVGQTVKVAEVDENGVPTAWMPVDFPTGGGSGDFYSGIELIVERTVTADEAAATSITFTKESYPLINSQKLVLAMIIKPAATQSTYFYIKCGSKIIANPQGGNWIFTRCVADARNGIWVWNYQSGSNYQNASLLSPYYRFPAGTNGIDNAAFEEYDSITIGSISAFLTEGTIIKIWGGKV